MAEPLISERCYGNMEATWFYRQFPCSFCLPKRTVVCLGPVRPPLQGIHRLSAVAGWQAISGSAEGEPALLSFIMVNCVVPVCYKGLLTVYLSLRGDYRSHEIVSFVCLRKEVKQYCDAVKLDRTHCAGR